MGELVGRSRLGPGRPCVSNALEREASRFAEELDELFIGVFDVEGAFAVVRTHDDASRRIGLAPFSVDQGGFSRFALRRSTDPDDRLYLNVEFNVTLDDTDGHLMVRRSTFGLWVRPFATKKTPIPMFRIEYDRDPQGDKPAAHVYIHADSAEFGWIIGSAGQPLRRHQEIHFPVGGRRFRPTVEDLLLFLDHEELFTEWPIPAWRSTVKASQTRYERAQARATMRRFPEEAARELSELGYVIGAPPE